MMKFLSLMTRQLPLIFLTSVALRASSPEAVEIVQQWGATPAQAATSGGGSTSGGQSGALDGSMTINCGISTLLFNGAVPPNGFMVQPFQIDIFVNDNGPANGPTANQSPSGFFVSGTSTITSPPPLNIFVTPPGYKPMGSVSVFGNCGRGGMGYVAARAW
jgi:hypothetical protein